MRLLHFYFFHFVLECFDNLYNIVFISQVAFFSSKIYYSVLLELYAQNFSLLYIICGGLRLCNGISNCGKGLITTHKPIFYTLFYS